MKVRVSSRGTEPFEHGGARVNAATVAVPAPDPPLHVAIVLRDFNTGGGNALAEMLGRGLRDAGHRVTYLIFYGGDGLLEKKARGAGFRIEYLRKRGRWDVSVILRLVRTVHLLDADVVYAMLPLSNLLCVAAKPLFPRQCGVVATIHNTARRDRAALSWQGRAAHWLNLRVVRWADHVIVNSPQAMAELQALSSLPSSKVTLVPNGVDLTGYRRDEAGARALEDEWKGLPSDLLFGLVATRLDHVKGHEVFLRAAARVAGRLPGSRFVCLGTGDPERRAALAALATELGIDGRLVWAGRRSDMPAVYSALDVLVVTSFNEGGPNVIAEAMACGTPCVSTDVGCAREMIGRSGRCVPIGDVAALADAMEELSRVSLEDPVSGQQACREQIAQNFGMTSYIDRNLEAMRITCESTSGSRRQLGLRRRTP